MDRSRRSNRPLVRAAGLVVLVGLLLGLLVGPASCTNDDDDPPPTTQPPDNPESEVESAYLAYWEMLERLSAAPDPADAEIDRQSTGTAKDEVVQALTALRDGGRIVRTGPLYRHEVLSVELDEREAVVEGCSVDDSVILDAATGDPVGGGTTATGLIEASMVLSDGSWKVSGVETLDSWAGEQTCEDR